MVLTVKIKKKLKNFMLDVDFSTEAGCMGILGASGSGKSMTLKCIAGIETPDEGIIILDNQVFFDSEQNINLKPQERRIGYLFQNYALFPNMTVKENIAIGWQTRHPHSKAEETTEQVRKMVSRFHLEGLEQAYPKNLSGGEQQRAAVARMLLSEPAVLMLDEPFSALDTYLKEELQAELYKTMQEFDGISVLVTHSRDEVYKLSDTLLIVENGRGIQHGNTKEMFRAPRTLAAARLTGCKNISPIRVLSDGMIQADKWNWMLRIPLEEAADPEPQNAKARRTKSTDVQYIGIRAHDFYIDRGEPDDKSSEIKVKIQEISEAPFEWNVMFMVDGAPENTDRLWWKVSKEQITDREKLETVKKLRIKTDRFLFLKA